MGKTSKVNFKQMFPKDGFWVILIWLVFWIHNWSNMIGRWGLLTIGWLHLAITAQTPAPNDVPCATRSTRICHNLASFLYSGGKRCGGHLSLGRRVSQSQFGCFLLYPVNRRRGASGILSGDVLQICSWKRMLIPATIKCGHCMFLQATDIFPS